MNNPHEELLDKASQELLDEYAEDKQQEEDTVTQGPTRIVGYHFGGQSFFPGKNGVRGVALGDPVNMPGMVMVKVTYRANNVPPRMFMVPLGSLVLEYDPSPIVVPNQGLVVPGRD